MGWCYTFGVDCHSGCKHPMIVRDSLDACECQECGTLCAGKFANCWRSVFQPNGRVLQLRCIPPNLPVSAEPASTEAVAVEVGELTEFVANAESGGNGNGHHESPDGDLAAVVERLSAEVERLSAQVAELGRREVARESVLDEMSERLTSISVSIPAVAPVKAVPRGVPGGFAGERSAQHARPGRAVAHPEAINSAPESADSPRTRASISESRAVGGTI